jgi:glucose/arabinose dehydrogenase
VRYPDAVPAAWSSGKPVVGVSGAAFITGAQWGDLNGQLAVSASTGRKLLIRAVGADGKIGAVTTPQPLANAFGELSGVRSAPSGDLLVTTGNGTDDKLLRVSPTG